MTYNHERAKVLCPEAAAEVERLQEHVDRLELAMCAMSSMSERSAMDIKGIMLEAVIEYGT